MRVVQILLVELTVERHLCGAVLDIVHYNVKP